MSLEEMREQIRTIPWLESCGFDLAAPFKRAHSWEEARRWSAKDEWEDGRLRAINALRVELKKKNALPPQAWNRIAQENREFLTREISPVLEPTLLREGLGKKHLDAIMWNLGGAQIEEFFGKHRPKRYFSSVLLPLYQQGFLPCGWDGEWPVGTLVVF